jgi:hypothetical protein
MYIPRDPNDNRSDWEYFKDNHDWLWFPFMAYGMAALGAITILMLIILSCFGFIEARCPA